MAISAIINQLGFERAISLTSDIPEISKSKAIILAEVRKFEIDEVYFCDDENQISYPAVFIKKVTAFDAETLKNIASTQKQIWNYKKVLFLYVCTDTEIRIYNCSEKPFAIKEENAIDVTDYEKELCSLQVAAATTSDKKKLEELNHIFSSVAIDTGIVWTAEEATSIRKKIKLQRRVDKYLVESLTKIAQELQKQGLDLNLIHKIMMRSLFLLYLEHRKATDAKFYAQFKAEATSYFNILSDVDATYKLYEKLAERFNGNLFTVEIDEAHLSEAQLRLIKKCFTSGYETTTQTQLFEDWKLFDFSIIQIELLSEIYENFLGEIEKQNTGTYYTPPSLVELILNEKLPINKNSDNDYNVKILDPACGSGIFLVESFKRLVKRYENKHKKKLTDFDILKKLLTDNVFGIEINSQSIKVAAFSLYLALVDHLDPKTIWQDANKKLPNLINDPKDTSIKIQGKNLYRRDTIEENKEIESIEFDLVVGNPPFGTKDLLPSLREYCDNENFAIEKVLPFLHKAVKFAPNGEIAMIFNTKVLTNTGTSYQKFRHWLFNGCYVEKVYNFSILRNAPENFGGQLFGAATGPISIVFYRNEEPENYSDRITYYAPKTFIKSNILEGVAIDNTDVKYLPREECQKSDTKIWKIAMWGGMEDWRLINRLGSEEFTTISSFTNKNNIKSGVGFQLLTQKKDTPLPSDQLSTMPYLDADFITRHFTNKEHFDNVRKSIKSKKAIIFYKNFYQVSQVDQIKELTDFRRRGDLKAYHSPHMVVKKGLENNSICASMLEGDCSFRDGVYGFYTDEEGHHALNVLMSYFNSRLSTYFLFMTISSYGIEREQIMKNEYLSIPINLDSDQIINIAKITETFLENLKNESFLKLQIDKPCFNEEIETIINNSLGLTREDVILIDDAIDISLDLFHKKEKSQALFPILNTNDYAQMLCKELNEFLDGQDLFANATTYTVNRHSPLMMIKISFEDKKEENHLSTELIDSELKKLDKKLWEEKATNIYFRKKLNYKDEDNIYIIRPNQRRFWTQTMAMEDAAELILEILNED